MTMAQDSTQLADPAPLPTAGPPKTYLPPTPLARETFLIHDHQGEGSAPAVVAMNAMVIRGKEPVVVDTGVHANEEQVLSDIFSLVEPQDIRWVFISHDDVDHTGNLNTLMASCPNATAVINWFITERMAASLEVAPQRWRWVGDGETLDVGDRVLEAVCPPIYDSPTTRGLLDRSTGVYWASDAFATPLSAPIRNVDELDVDAWTQGMSTFAHYLSPWLSIVDTAKYARSVHRVVALEPVLIAGTHTPAIGPSHVPIALDTIRTCHQAVPVPQPDQRALDALLRPGAP
jgi:flavorubredoxin